MKELDPLGYSKEILQNVLIEEFILARYIY